MTGLVLNRSKYGAYGMVYQAVNQTIDLTIFSPFYALLRCTSLRWNICKTSAHGAACITTRGRQISTNFRSFLLSAADGWIFSCGVNNFSVHVAAAVQRNWLIFNKCYRGRSSAVLMITAMRLVSLILVTDLFCNNNCVVYVNHLFNINNKPDNKNYKNNEILNNKFIR